GRSSTQPEAMSWRSGIKPMVCAARHPVLHSGEPWQARKNRGFVHPRDTGSVPGYAFSGDFPVKVCFMLKATLILSCDPSTGRV
ncbi:MAG: hypothetical protein LBD93_11405, partial [Treponema sp.]|nr:hypothetical protein [Treponema sp.]